MSVASKKKKVKVKKKLKGFLNGIFGLAVAQKIKYMSVLFKYQLQI